MNLLLFFKGRFLISNQQGLSLIGVLVASSLSVVVAMGVTKLATHLSGVSKRASVQFEMIDIVNEIRTHLRKEISCVSTFSNVKIVGQTLSPFTSPPLIPTIFDKEGEVVYKKDCYEEGVTETPCRKGNIKFVEFKPLPPEESTLPFVIDLFVFLGHREGSKVTHTRNYPIKVLISELDTTGRITKCQALGGGGPAELLTVKEALEACNETMTGIVRFNMEERLLEYCNGEGWDILMKIPDNEEEVCTGNISVYISQRVSGCRKGRWSSAGTVYISNLKLKEGENRFYIRHTSNVRKQSGCGPFYEHLNIVCNSDGTLEKTAFSFNPTRTPPGVTGALIRTLPNTGGHRNMGLYKGVPSEIKVKDLFPFLQKKD